MSSSRCLLLNARPGSLRSLDTHGPHDHPLQILAGCGVELAAAVNVIPVIESGETETDWVLVMPRAETSLEDYLLAAGSALDQAEAISILTDIATALESLHGKVVHRDLKPGNILRSDGRWCLADFGISRYAEATT
ncbi:MAG: protein kinase family protein, partial [Chloroflexia bacterium]|nr:protein kinase family protein [Chloroflexia bacterium]